MHFKEIIQKLFVRPPAETPEEIPLPDNLFVQCTQCKEVLYRKNLHTHCDTCPHCGNHFSISVQRWIQILGDAGSWKPLFQNLQPSDPLHFPEYQGKLRKLERKEPDEAIATGRCSVAGIPILTGIMNPNFFMGSMGSVCGEKITRLFELGLEERLPVMLVIRSGGARMQEGVLSLMQMAKTAAAIRRFSEAGLLYVCLLTHPTTGGVSASFAMLGDIILAEPGALIGFAGPRVIEQTIRQQLPEGFQRAEYLQDKGFVDRIVKRTEIRSLLEELLKLHAYKSNPEIAVRPTKLWSRLTQWIRKN